ncbi:MarR family transcriptional regulator [Paenibacillus sp. FSL H8-0122]|uniref:MarR family winged helix-turn-helix transcriptional regulator n=1 Tax=Paenibacillus sp. FSL H8-0122 TaxID=2954510 RepID=UPI0030F5CD79
MSLISKIREKVNRFIVQEMAKQGVNGIATSHGDIIYALLHKHRLTMAELSTKIHKDKSTVTALVDKLVRLGLVMKERDQEDTRYVYVTLTGKGKELEPVFESVSSAMLKQFYRDITEEEQKTLLTILMKINHNF